jgi:hypothetical protein
MNIIVVNRYGLALTLLVISFLSFQINLFRVMPQSRFEAFELVSDALVLDGIVHHRFAPYNGMGMYERPSPDPSSLLDEQLHIDTLQDNRAFYPYRSQFGLQYYAFNFLHTGCGLSVWQLEATASFLMALIVAGYFVALRRVLPTPAAVGFCLTLALSPWVVCFARNLFWVEASWFLPCLVSLLIGDRRPTRANCFSLASFLFLVTLIKCLCGYDFISTVCLSAIVPLVYYQSKSRFSTREIVRQLAVAGGAMFFAFAFAMGLHITLLSHRVAPMPNTANRGPVESANTDTSGLGVIVQAFEKRFYSKDPDKTSREVCAMGPPENYDDCVMVYKRSLQSSVFRVVARYLVATDMVPWVSGNGLNASDKSILTSSFLSIKAKHLSEAFRRMESLHESGFASLIRYCVSPALFLVLIALVGRVIYLRKARWELAWVGVAFIAPISWYAAAKGYSQIHTHLCLVLWYLPFVPASIALLLSEYWPMILGRSRSGSKLK